MPCPARGVYTAPYLSPAGLPVKLAISSDGRRLAEMEVKGDPKVISRRLWVLLDTQDPGVSLSRVARPK